MKRHTKFTSQEQEQRSEIKAQPTSAREFTSPEEMLRHDAIHTIVPTRVVERLDRSIQNEPKPCRSWWQRLFGQ